MSNPKDCKYCRTTANGDDEPCTSLLAAHECPWMSTSDWKALENRAAPAQGEPVAWQPIDTAPRDGTGFLACIGMWQTVCCWNKHRNDWCAVAPGYPSYEKGEYPTHWMLLPSSPTPAMTRTTKGRGNE